MHRDVHNRYGDNMKYLFQIMYLCVIFISTTQIQPTLKEYGFDLLQCAYFYSGSAFVGYLLQKLWFKLSQRMNVNVGMKCGLIIIVLFYYLLTQSFLIFLSAVLLFALAKTLININEVYCYECKNEYGYLRCFASIGMAIGAIVSCYWVNNQIYIISMITIVLVFIPIKSYQKPNVSSQKVSWQKSDYYFILMLSILYAIGSADQYIVTAKILALKGSRELIGWKMCIQCLSELPFYYFMQKILKRFSYEKLMKWAIIFFMIRFGLYAYVDDCVKLIWISTLQAVTLPLMMSSSKLYISNMHPQGDGSQGRMLSLFTSIAFITAPILYGFLQIYFSFNVVLYACSLSCFIVLFLQRKLDLSLK